MIYENIETIREILTDSLSLYTKQNWILQDHVLLRNQSNKGVEFEIRAIAGLNNRALKQITRDLFQLGLKISDWAYHKGNMNIYIEVLDK